MNTEQGTIMERDDAGAPERVRPVNSIWDTIVVAMWHEIVGHPRRDIRDIRQYSSGRVWATCGSCGSTLELKEKP